MEFFAMTDVHLGIRNEKIEKEFENTFRETIKDISESSSQNVVLIGGDFFNYPIVRNDVTNFFLQVAKEFKRRVKFIISSGNHDSSPIHETATLNIHESASFIQDDDIIFENDQIKVLEYEYFEDLPNITIATSKMKRIIINDEEVMIDCLPFYQNKEKFTLRGNDKKACEKAGYKSILLCHGVTDDVGMYSQEEIIHSSYLKKRDLIIKGHVHKVFDYELFGSPVYSLGSLNKNAIDSEGIYCKIILGEKLKVEEILVREELSVNYKVFDCETPETINKTFLTLGEKDIVSISYFGDPDKINSNEYSRCYNECLKFSFVFKDIDLSVDNYLTKTNYRAQNFIGFHEFMKGTLDNMSEDSDCDILLKIYNEVKNNS